MVSFLEMRTKEEGHAWWKEAELMNLKCPWAPLGRGPLACDRGMRRQPHVWEASPGGGCSLPGRVSGGRRGENLGWVT